MLKCNLESVEAKLQQVLEYSLLSAKNVLTLDEVALLTGLSKSYLYKLTSAGQIPFYKPCGKMMYFDRKEVEAWMKRNRRNATYEAETAAIAYVTRKGGIQ